MPDVDFKEVAELYLQLSNDRFGKSWPDGTEKMLKKWILPRWQQLPVADITRAHGLELLLDVSAQSHNEVVSVASVILDVFDYAFRKGHISSDPMLGFIKIKEPVPVSTSSLDGPVFGL